MFIFDDKFNNSYFTDNPPDPVFFNEPLEPTFIQPLIQNSLPKVNPSSITNHVLQRTTPPKDGLCPLDAVTSCDGSLLSQQPLLSFDDLEWFNTSSSSKASTVSASAPAFAPVAATLPQDDASGFDQLSLLDEICASVSSTPFTSHLDSPDPSHQTPLFDSVASEVLDIAAPNQFWNSADSDINLASSMTAGGLNLDLNLGLISPISSTSPLASTTFLEEKDASDQDLSQAMSRLQAENALLDFVLYDDITHPSPISTLMATPETTSVSSPMFSDSTFSQDIDTDELAKQLVTAAATNMANQLSTVSALTSPLMNDSSDLLGNLFSDVDLSLTKSVTPTMVTSSPQMSLDWMSDQLSQNPPFDFSNNNSSSSTAAVHPFSTESSPLLPLIATSPQLDLSLLLSLYDRHQQSLITSLTMKTVAAAMAAVSRQQSTLTTVTSMSTAPAATTQTTPLSTDKNPLKRKSDELESNGDTSSSPRQFACKLCGRAFSRLFNLNTHERTHDRSKARLFACPEKGCKKSFTRKNDLQRHQISIHGVTHIYSCQTCNKPFMRKDELRRHMDLKSCEDDHSDQPSTNDSNKPKDSQ